MVRIDLAQGTAADYRATVADTVYRALVDVAGAPENDRFLVISEHPPGNLLIAPHYFVDHSDEAMIIQIFLNQGRSLEVKKALYEAVANGLHENVGLRPEDVVIALVDVPKENWSYGLGQAQYAE